MRPACRLIISPPPYPSVPIKMQHGSTRSVRGWSRSTVSVIFLPTSKKRADISALSHYLKNIIFTARIIADVSSPDSKRAGINHSRSFYVFLINLFPHFGQVISILPFPFGTRIFCVQEGHLKNLKIFACSLSCPRLSKYSNIGCISCKNFVFSLALLLWLCENTRKIQISNGIKLRMFSL